MSWSARRSPEDTVVSWVVHRRPPRQIPDARRVPYGLQRRAFLEPGICGKLVPAAASPESRSALITDCAKRFHDGEISGWCGEVPLELVDEGARCIGPASCQIEKKQVLVCLRIPGEKPDFFTELSFRIAGTTEPGQSIAASKVEARNVVDFSLRHERGDLIGEVEGCLRIPFLVFHARQSDEGRDAFLLVLARELRMFAC